jgi:hypothetical protein
MEGKQGVVGLSIPGGYYSSACQTAGKLDHYNIKG